MTVASRIRRLLDFIYGPEQGEQTWQALRPRLEHFATAQQASNPTGGAVAHPDGRGLLSERDALLITYGDTFQEPGRPPLQTLADFLDEYLNGAISGVHLLPFYPYSSDDGFSVIDYRQVAPDLGGWGDIRRLEGRYRLMFDLVLNHISRHSQWFQAYLRGQAPYDRYFITAGTDWDLSRVVRPRTLPLLTEVETADGPHQVWTTFSDDQIDLNYANPQVLLEIVDLVLFYLSQGASLLRLDAIAYLWKQPGTTCLHLPETHAVVQLLRAVLDWVAPEVQIITETNVPHEDNLSYFGQVLPEGGGTDEAQLVYGFSLAPLTLHAFARGDASRLSRWAASLNAPGPFFNFIASHDGIGLLPAYGLLPPEEIQALVDQTQAHGGRVSYKANGDGQAPTPYELNITLYDALNDPAQPEPEIDRQRFLASQAIMLALAGVPGIYVHSLFGSRNWQAGLAQTGRARTINREKFDYPALRRTLTQPDSQAAHILAGYRRLLAARQSEAAFNPSSPQQVIEANPAVFALKRAPQTGRPVLCLTNVSNTRQPFQLDLAACQLPAAAEWRDLLAGGVYRPEAGRLDLQVEPYGTLWLAPVAASNP